MSDPIAKTTEILSDYPIVELSTDALLTTTRSVRKRLDLTKPVAIGLIRECLEIAVQAPTSGNAQNWSFIIVTDAEQRRAIGDVCRRAWDLIVASSHPCASEISKRTTMDGNYLPRRSVTAPVTGAGNASGAQSSEAPNGPRGDVDACGTASSIHASVHGGALLTRVNTWLG